MSIRFDDQVAIVTGAGGGIGKEHALELARRGAKVVVNDLGGSVDGSGTSDAAEAVVQQIKDAGGEAMAMAQALQIYQPYRTWLKKLWINGEESIFLLIMLVF